MSLLESLYHGNLLPQEQIVPQDPQYRELTRELSSAMIVWKKKLSSADFADLEALIDLQQQVQGIEMAEAFTQGFRLGAGLMVEVLHKNYR
ncbi:DUF6809 family protein [Paenibacillus sanguinis]|uniref:DUF6809 family protein n=1 Tax=Paenibacillus sanguinis TaxID=225906 RepID=UPI00037B5349|nr:DUF6809 family protein [Paenibacillus sanguinis]